MAQRQKLMDLNLRICFYHVLHRTQIVYIDEHLCNHNAIPPLANFGLFCTHPSIVS